MDRSWLCGILVLLLLLNGMGYTIIQLHFYLDREQITALHCVNQDRAELQCKGSCELTKRLSQAKDRQSDATEVTLEELSLTFLAHSSIEQVLLPSPVLLLSPPSARYCLEHTPDRGQDFFHPPQG